MQKISGLVLDVYDDSEGQILNSLYPKYEDIPDFIKTAEPVTQEDLDALPDDVFALILRQGDTTLRKYACVDAGNTTLHIGYFLSNFDKLPVEAIKVAAQNLVTACGWYDIEPPEELKKLSTGALVTIGRQRVWKDQEGGIYGSDGQHWDIQKTAALEPADDEERSALNKYLNAFSGPEHGPNVPKTADVVGTMDMPTQGSKETLVRTKKTPLSYAKTAEGEIAHLVDTDKANKGDADTILEQAFGVKEKNEKAEPQVTTVLHPHVDVTDKEPSQLIEEKHAQHYALPYARRYPLDSYGQVKAASAYFDNYHKMLPPEDRHAFAVNLLRRATPMDIGVSKLAQQYGQTNYAAPEHLQVCIEQRLQLLAPHTQGFNLHEKTASEHSAAHTMRLYTDLFSNRGLLGPEVYASTLTEIDKLAGLDEYWDQDVIDPYLSTFDKVAEHDDIRDTLVVGNEYMRVSDLKAIAAAKPQILRKRFSEELVTEFQKDPVAIFESLPLDQKLVFMRIANDATETRMS
jgi:hypothetical protein